MDKILPGIIAGVIVLVIGFVIFYFFIEYYAKRRINDIEGDFMDEKLKRLDEILPLIEDAMKRGFELEDDFVTEYIGSEDDEKLASEICCSVEEEVKSNQPPSKDEKANNVNKVEKNLFDDLYEKL